MYSEQSPSWYYSIDEVSYGPVSRKELLSLISCGKLGPQSFVWRSEFGNKWRRICDLDELDVRVNLEGTYSTNQRTCAENERPQRPDTPGVLAAAKGAFRWTVQSLFRKSSFLEWILLAFTFWLGATGTAVLSIDTRTFEQNKDFADSTFGALLLCARDTQNFIFEKTGIVPWAIILFLITLFLSYFKVRGRLMTLHLLHFPKDHIRSAWKRCKGITRPMVYFYTIVDFIETASFSFLAYNLFQVLGTEILAKGSPLLLWEKVTSSPDAGRLFFAGASVFLVFEFVKLFAYHFAEPFVYGRGVTMLSAMRAAMRFSGCNFLKTVRFFLFLLLFHISVLLLMGLLLVLLSFLLSLFGLDYENLIVSLFTFALLPAKVLLLPVYYFIRALGPKMLGVL